MTQSSENLVRVADVARELGLSPTRIRQLADAEVIPSSRTPGGHRLFDLGAVRAAIARRTLPEDPLTVATEATPSWRHELTLLGLSEDVVWRRVAEDLHLDKESPAGKIMSYVFTEMLNNAIDHSGSETGRLQDQRFKGWFVPRFDSWSCLCWSCGGFLNGRGRVPCRRLAGAVVRSRQGFRSVPVA